MRYDFDRIINRNDTYCSKWSVPGVTLPMWVADMDFETAPEVKEALIRRAEHGVFGYTEVPEGWYEAYINWWKLRHKLTIKKSQLVFSTGVIPTISSVVRKLTTPNENVVIMTPVYNIFFNSVINNGARALECPLYYDPSAKRGPDESAYSVDLERLENALSDPQTSLLLLCNPQNPTGNIWDKDTLSKIGDMAAKHGVIVLSDEIHCDLVDPGYEYVPFASVSETCAKISISCFSPTKTFNIAGLQTSAVYVPDPHLRHKVYRAINTDECGEPNCFAVEAAVSAFDKGAGYLDELRSYLKKNKDLVREYVAENIPGTKVVSGPATYLMWLDMTSYGKSSKELQTIIKEKTGLLLSEGKIYGSTGEGFMRMNIACPRSMVLDGLSRLKEALCF